MRTKTCLIIATVLLLATVLAACQPISSNPAIADPVAHGFEAVPPPAEAGLVLPNPDKTTLLFTTGEECAWAGDTATMVDGKRVTFTCGEEDGNQIVLLGDFASVQGQAFSIERALLAPDANAEGGVRVVQRAPLPFTVLDIVLTNGVSCFVRPDNEAIVVDDARIAFTCDNGIDQPDPLETNVLLNGIYMNAAGEFEIEAALWPDESAVAVLGDRRPMSIASVTAHPQLVRVSQEENGKTVTLTQGQILEVMLASNPTTGYHWVLAPTTTAPLTQAADAEFIPDSDAIGAGGVEILRFDIAGVGSGTLQLEHVPPSGNGSAIEDFTLEVVVALTPADSGSAVAIEQGQTLALALPGNPTTGYAWQVVEMDNAILAQTGDPTLVRPSSQLGAGGIQFIPFAGVAAGTTTLTLEYARPFESIIAPANTFTVQVTVE